MKLLLTIALELPDEAINLDRWIGWDVMRGGAMVVTACGIEQYGITEAVVVKAEKA